MVPTPIIMWMQTDNDLFSLRDVGTEILYLHKNQEKNHGRNNTIRYLISIMVWGSNLDCRGQVEDDPVETSPRFTPSRLDSFADLNRKFGFGLRECLWTVLVAEASAVFFGVFLSQLPDK